MSFVMREEGNPSFLLIHTGFVTFPLVRVRLVTREGLPLVHACFITREGGYPPPHWFCHLPPRLHSFCHQGGVTPSSLLVHACFITREGGNPPPSFAWVLSPGRAPEGVIPTPSSFSHFPPCSHLFGHQGGLPVHARFITREGSYPPLSSFALVSSPSPSFHHQRGRQPSSLICTGFITREGSGGGNSSSLVVHTHFITREKLLIRACFITREGGNPSSLVHMGFVTREGATPPPSSFTLLSSPEREATHPPSFAQVSSPGRG